MRSFSGGVVGEAIQFIVELFRDTQTAAIDWEYIHGGPTVFHSLSAWASDRWTVRASTNAVERSIPPWRNFVNDRQIDW